MSGARLVVDASVIVTALIEPGEAGERIVQRLRGAELHAPDHLAVEVTNSIRRRRNSGLLSPAESALAIDSFWSLPLTLWPFETLAERTWLLGDNLSSYDGAYVALAELLTVPLVTRDAGIARAPGPRCDIELVG